MTPMTQLGILAVAVFGAAFVGYQLLAPRAPPAEPLFSQAVVQRPAQSPMQPGNQTPTQSAATCKAFDDTSQVWIPGGTFRFGTDNAYPEESPAREVTVKGFWMDQHEVTNAQFAAFVKATDHVTVAERAPDPKRYPNIPPDKLVPGSAIFSPSEQISMNAMPDMSDSNQWWLYMPGANWRQPDGPGSTIDGKDHLPVTHIAYADALAYAQWKGRDLPTEAEWEFAARGNRAATPDDDAPIADIGPDGKFRGNTWQGAFPVINEVKDGYNGLAPVGCFAPNGYGLYDMTGNVWEWTKTWYQPNHTEVDPKTFHDPNQPGISVRVIKGGSYLCARNYCWRYRPSSRQAQDVEFSSGHIGFRTVSRILVADRIPIESQRASDDVYPDVFNSHKLRISARR